MRLRIAVPPVLIALLTLFVIVHLGRHAHAAHPLVTDDVGTLGGGTLEVETSVLGGRPAGGALDLGVGLSIHAGLSEGLDLGVTTAWDGLQARLVDPVLDLKWRLAGTPDRGLALRIDYRAPQAGGVASGHDLGVTFAASRVGEGAEAHVNAGFSRTGLASPSTAWVATASSALLLRLAPSLAACAELAAAWTLGQGTSGAVTAAVLWQLSPSLVMSGGAGPDWGGTPSPGWHTTLGLTFVAG